MVHHPCGSRWSYHTEEYQEAGGGESDAEATKDGSTEAYRFAISPDEDAEDVNERRANEETEGVHDRPGYVRDLSAVGIAVEESEEQHGTGDDSRRYPSFTGYRGSNEHD